MVVIGVVKKTTEVYILSYVITNLLNMLFGKE